MNRDYCLAKLYGAVETLTTHPGTLPERVQAASGDLVKFSGCEEFTSAYQPIQEIMVRVHKRDWDSLSGADYHFVAVTALELCLRLR